MTDAQKEIVSRIEEKYKAINQNPDVHLEGLVWANPITYWDYIFFIPFISINFIKGNTGC